MQIIYLDDRRKTKLIEQRLWMERLWQWADRLDIKEYNLPRNEYELLNLTHLSFESYTYYKREKFTELPKEIGNLTKLKFLELGHVVNCEMQFLNSLIELPKEIGKLTELTHLYIQSNRLTELPIEIGNLTRLKELKLGFNQLITLPQEIGDLKQLEILTMWQNRITELPPEIGNLKQLKGLSVWGNPLVKLPQEIVNLTELKELELGRNVQLSALQKDWVNKLKRNAANVHYM
jgi:Leucine-rich repeat (LRR) protein